MTSYLAIAEENADWMRMNPRQHIIRFCTKSGNYGCMYWSKTSNGLNEGVAIWMDNDSLLPIIYPITNTVEVVGRFESQMDYYYHKRSSHAKQS